MIRVRYEKYYNDYRNSQEVQSFYSLEELADWLFGMVKGDYKRSTWFTDPDEDHLRDGKLHLDNSCITSRDGQYTYWIEQIEKDGVIIYSCGTYTNKVCHWNDEIKQWLRQCRERRSNPHFNFG